MRDTHKVQKLDIEKLIRQNDNKYFYRLMSLCSESATYKRWYSWL